MLTPSRPSAKLKTAWVVDHGCVLSLTALTNFWPAEKYQMLMAVMPPVYRPASWAFSTHSPPATLGLRPLGFSLPTADGAVGFGGTADAPWLP